LNHGGHGDHRAAEIEPKLWPLEPTPASPIANRKTHAFGIADPPTGDTFITNSFGAAHLSLRILSRKSVRCGTAALAGQAYFHRLRVTRTAHDSLPRKLPVQPGRGHSTTESTEITEQQKWSQNYGFWNPPPVRRRRTIRRTAWPLRTHRRGIASAPIHLEPRTSLDGYCLENLSGVGPAPSPVNPIFIVSG